MQEAITEVQRRNVELVRQITDPDDSGRSAYDRYEQFFEPDLEWRPRTIGFGKHVYRGREGFGRYVDDMEASFEEVNLSVAELRPIAQHHVLLVGRLRVVGKGGGVPVDNEWAILFRIEAGLVRSGTAFDNHAEAEEASRAHA